MTIVAGVLDDLRARDLRLLEVAAQSEPLTVCLWTDQLAARLCGRPPKFPLAERQYFLSALRWVARVIPVDDLAGPNTLPELPTQTGASWAVSESEHDPAKAAFARTHGLHYRVISGNETAGFPVPEEPVPAPGDRKRVVVTGCYDWFHSGHVRFLEEVSAHGDVYVVVGHDANIRQLKGEGHPLLCQEERRYVVRTVRHVTRALISTGEGWLDAEPEIRRIQPHIYAVNEDGDKGGKREFCERNGIEYLVLKRTPAPGLPRRSSTDLRGF